MPPPTCSRSHPAGTETWGLVVTEAMIFGLPVVVSDESDAHLILVREGINGYVFDHRKPGDLARWLSLLVSDEALRRRLGAAGTERHRILELWGRGRRDRRSVAGWRTPSWGEAEAGAARYVREVIPG